LLFNGKLLVFLPVILFEILLEILLRILPFRMQGALSCGIYFCPDGRILGRGDFIPAQANFYPM
jgi:hypothetical protein